MDRTGWGKPGHFRSSFVKPQKDIKIIKNMIIYQKLSKCPGSKLMKLPRICILKIQNRLFTVFTTNFYPRYWSCFSNRWKLINLARISFDICFKFQNLDKWKIRTTPLLFKTMTYLYCKNYGLKNYEVLILSCLTRKRRMKGTLPWKFRP